MADGGSQGSENDSAVARQLLESKLAGLSCLGPIASVLSMVEKRVCRLLFDTPEAYLADCLAETERKETIKVALEKIEAKVESSFLSLFPKTPKKAIHSETSPIKNSTLSQRFAKNGFALTQNQNTRSWLFKLRKDTKLMHERLEGLQKSLAEKRAAQSQALEELERNEREKMRTKLLVERENRVREAQQRKQRAEHLALMEARERDLRTLRPKRLVHPRRLTEAERHQDAEKRRLAEERSLRLIKMDFNEIEKHAVEKDADRLIRAAERAIRFPLAASASLSRPRKRPRSTEAVRSRLQVRRDFSAKVHSYLRPPRKEIAESARLSRGLPSQEPHIAELVKNQERKALGLRYLAESKRMLAPIETTSPAPSEPTPPLSSVRTPVAWHPKPRPLEVTVLSSKCTNEQLKYLLEGVDRRAAITRNEEKLACSGRAKLALITSLLEAK